MHRRPRSTSSKVAWLAAIVAVAIYSPTLWGTFVYDDLFHCLQDPRLNSPGEWGQYFSQGYYPGGVDKLWRPLVSLSYGIQHYLHGPRAWAFHAVNILLHALVSGLVAELARRLAGPIAGFLAGLLFAVHPVHVEAVAYIVGRAETLCAAGVLGAMLLTTRPVGPWRAVSIWACILLAIGSKEQGLLAAPLVAGMWWSCGRQDDKETREQGDKEGKRQNAKGMGTGEGNDPFSRDPRGSASQREKRDEDIKRDGSLFSPQSEIGNRKSAIPNLLAVAVMLTLAAYIGWREHILKWHWDESLLDWGTQPMIRSQPSDRALIPFALLGRYTMLLIFPAKLSPEYGLGVIGPNQSLSDPMLYVGIIAAVAIAAGILIAILRRRWTALVLIAGAATSYGMIANIKLIGTIMGERLLYLPSAFVLILAAMTLAHRFAAPRPEAIAPFQPTRLAATRRKALPHALLLVFAIVLCLGSLRAITYATRWNDRLGFYETCLEETPRSARIRALLAVELLQRRQLDRAQGVIEDGLKIHPDYWLLWKVLADIQIEQRRFGAARKSIERACDLGGPILELMGVDERLQKAREIKH